MANIPNFFNSDAFKALGDEQRKAMTAAFDAMSNWRQELNTMQEKNSSAVFDKMASASKTLGWPTDMVEMTRQQIQSATKMQSQMIEQVMDTWEKAATNPSGFKFEMPKFPGMGGGFPGGFPGMPSFGQGGSMFPGMPGMPDMMTPMMPMQLWMQAAEMWQKNWQQALNTWMDAQKSMMSAGQPTKPGPQR